MHTTALKLTTSILVIVSLVYWYFFSLSQPLNLSVLHTYGDVSFDSTAAMTETTSMLADRVRVKTGSNGVATFQLDDGSRIQVLPNSELTIEQARQDRRHQNSEVELNLNAGEIIKRVPVHDNRTRKSSLFTNSVNIGVRGTEFVVMAEPDISRLMVTEGKVVAEGKKGSQVEVPVDFGTVVNAGQEAMKPVPLLLPPAPVMPVGNDRVLTQNVTMDWQSENNATAWAFEIANDPEFVTLWRHELKTEDVALVDGFARDGTYYWRVASVDEHGLRGRWSEPQAFSYKYYFELGRLSLMDSDFDKALQAFASAEEGYIDELGYLVTEAGVFLNDGEFAKSRQYFSMIDKLIPRSRETQNGLARVDVEEGLYDQAWVRINELLRTQADDTYTLETAAMAAVGVGDYAKAKSMAERVLSLDADNVTAKLILDSID